MARHLWFMTIGTVLFQLAIFVAGFWVTWAVMDKLHARAKRRSRVFRVVEHEAASMFRLGERFTYYFVEQRVWGCWCLVDSRSTLAEALALRDRLVAEGRPSEKRLRVVG